VADELVVSSLLKYIQEVGPGKIDPMMSCVIGHVIRHCCGGHISEYFAGIGIEDDQLTGIAGTDKKLMSSFIEAAIAVGLFASAYFFTLADSSFQSDSSAAGSGCEQTIQM